MSDFAEAVDALFEDANLSVTATRMNALGVVSSLPVLRRRPDQEQSWNGGRILAEGDLLEIRVSDAADLSEGDVFTIGGETLKIVGDPSRDNYRLVWLAQVRPI